MTLTKIRKSQVNGLLEELNKIKEQIKTYREPVALLSDLPIENNNEGDIRVCLEDKNVYVWSDNQWHINTVKGSFAKTIFLQMTQNDQTIINTGIRFDNQGNNRTNSNVINLYLNGVLVDKNNYTVENVNEEMVITWLSIDFHLEENDLIAIQFYDVTGGLKLNLNGSSNDSGISGETGTLIVSKAILPSTTKTVDIGSEDLRFKSIYVDEAHLDANTLYIDGVPVLGSNADTILIKANPDQGISVKTTGIGSTKLMSENNVELTTNGMNADVNVKASGIDSKVNITGTSQVNLNAVNINLNGITSMDDLTVKGNLSVQGTTTTVDAVNLTVKDNIIELNKGELGNGVTVGQSGIKIDRGDSSDILLIFDESDDQFKMGETGALKTIASKEWVEEQLNNFEGSNGGNNTNNECSVVLGKLEW